MSQSILVPQGKGDTMTPWEGVSWSNVCRQETIKENSLPKYFLLKPSRVSKRIIREQTCFKVK